MNPNAPDTYFEGKSITNIEIGAACAEPGKGLVIADFVHKFHTLRILRDRRI